MLRPLLFSILLSLPPAALAGTTLGADRDALREHYGERAVIARGEALDLLAPLVARCPGDDRIDRTTCVDIHLRYGGLLIEEAAYRWEGELAAWQERHDAWPDGAAGPEPQPDHGVSRGLRQQAITALRAALTLDPEHPRASEARFDIGQTLLLLEHPDAALTWLRLLVDLDPEGPLTPDALLTIGEVWMDRDAPHKALPALRRASALESPLRPWILTRLAWARAGVGDVSGAIDAVTEALQDTPDAAFAPEARAALVHYLGETSDPERARGLIEQLSPKEDSGRLLSALADRWTDQGRGDLTLDLLGGLLSSRPSDRSAPHWQARLVRLHTHADRFEAASQAAAQLLATYGPGSDHAQSDEDVVDLCERTQRELAVALHRAALLGAR